MRTVRGTSYFSIRFLRLLTCEITETLSTKQKLPKVRKIDDFLEKSIMNAPELLNVPDSPPKVSNFSEDSIDLSIRAYSKIILHAAKYPHCAVNGVLLAKSPAKGQKIAKLSLIDAIPLFHQNLGLTPMIEVALTQIEAHASGVGMTIAGKFITTKKSQNHEIRILKFLFFEKIRQIEGISALLNWNVNKLSRFLFVFCDFDKIFFL